MDDATGHRWVDEQPRDVIVVTGENTEIINKIFFEFPAEKNPRTGMVLIIILGCFFKY